MSLGISDAVELTRKIGELVKKGITIDLQERVMELREAVLNAKDEVLSLREENAELKKLATQRAEMKYDTQKETYWIGEDQANRDGPFCARCFDVDGKQLRLKRRDNVFGTYQCPQCETYTP